ncbi:MAG: hypothetical protein ACREPC_05290, partial [Stenotrophomonas sp.]
MKQNITVSQFAEMLNRVRPQNAEPFEIAMLIAVILLAGWLGSFFYPSRDMAISQRGATANLVGSVIGSGLFLYLCGHVLNAGYMLCLLRRKRSCGSGFFDVHGRYHGQHERLLSWGANPIGFWISFAILGLITIFLVAWCVRSW